MTNEAMNDTEVTVLTEEDMATISGGSNCGLGQAIFGLSAITGDVAGLLLGATAMSIYC
jgi:bacteriocin-like protein